MQTGQGLKRGYSAPRWMIDVHGVLVGELAKESDPATPRKLGGIDKISGPCSPGTCCVRPLVLFISSAIDPSRIVLLL
jgi:hypothetical protein